MLGRPGVGMQTWIAVFVVVAALAIVVQAAILIALFLQMRRTMERMDQFTSDLQSRVGPILTRVQLLLDDTQPRISELVADAAHVVYLARGQAQKMDRIFTDASDRLRGQCEQRLAKDVVAVGHGHSIGILI